MGSMRTTIDRRNFAIAMAAFIMSAPRSATAKRKRKRRGRRGRRHDDAYQARDSGKILPLVEILKKIAPEITGEIIETEFELKNGVPIYEFKFIAPGGRVMELYVDARTAKIIKRKKK